MQIFEIKGVSVKIVNYFNVIEIVSDKGDQRQSNNDYIFICDFNCELLSGGVFLNNLNFY